MAQIDLRDRVLIVPVVSTANVSQLAADVMIASFFLQRIQSLDLAKYLIPVVGARDDNVPGIVTPLELYGSPDCRFAVIQQRSPAVKAYKQQFVDALLAFCQDASPSAIIFLSGVDTSDRTDEQMITLTYYYIPSSSPLDAACVESAVGLPIPCYTSPVTPSDALASAKSNDGVPFMPGGGLTRRILRSVTSTMPPTLCLIQFCTEGDNGSDAKLLAAVCSKLINVEPAQWRQPSSWETGLFGTPHVQKLYG
ncbi:hypothetical protein FISHEDRAFT_67535 [Fistulina hepatica ATCC 64428]|uniref:Proteasome assembly chaperone 2 n=1 Tax=Fistulina hepatica ATCC 64428 TaxID=1128425 RepID=A0A0D7A3E8_9AGAR|nr:hypothetical protein FISHEDRAFT_67535 [Fistulina hepatica ATCC 64428]